MQTLLFSRPIPSSKRLTVAVLLTPIVLATSGNCPDCEGVTWEQLAAFSKNEYSPQKMMCSDSGDSNYECLVSSLYEDTISKRGWTCDPFPPLGPIWNPGTWVNYTYNPCYTDDTGCGGNGS